MGQRYPVALRISRNTRWSLKDDEGLLFNSEHVQFRPQRSIPQDGSRTVEPAKERREIDWDTANRLITQNKDFRDYIKLVREFYQTGDPRVNDWDAKVEQD